MRDGFAPIIIITVPNDDDCDQYSGHRHQSELRSDIICMAGAAAMGRIWMQSNDASRFHNSDYVIRITPL